MLAVCGPFAAPVGPPPPPPRFHCFSTRDFIYVAASPCNICIAIIRPPASQSRILPVPAVAASASCTTSSVRLRSPEDGESGGKKTESGLLFFSFHWFIFATLFFPLPPWLPVGSLARPSAVAPAADANGRLWRIGCPTFTVLVEWWWWWWCADGWMDGGWVDGGREGGRDG